MKIQSKTHYDEGTIIYCEDTGECYEVINSVRISLFDEYKYGLELKEVTNLGVTNEL